MLYIYCTPSDVAAAALSLAISGTGDIAEGNKPASDRASEPFNRLEKREGRASSSSRKSCYRNVRREGAQRGMIMSESCV